MLGASSKVLVDVKNGNNLMYLPLDQLMKPREAQGAGKSGTGASSSGASRTSTDAGADDGGSSGRQAPRSLYNTNRTEIR